MVTVGDYNPWVVCSYGNHHRLCIRQRIDLPAIHDGFYSQKTEQNLILSLQDNMIRGSNSLLF